MSLKYAILNTPLIHFSHSSTLNSTEGNSPSHHFNDPWVMFFLKQKLMWPIITFFFFNIITFSTYHAARCKYSFSVFPSPFCFQILNAARRNKLKTHVYKLNLIYESPTRSPKIKRVWISRENYTIGSTLHSCNLTKS